VKTSLWAVGILPLLYAGVVASDIAESLFGPSDGFWWAPVAMLLGLAAVAWWRVLRGSGNDVAESKRGTP
jgi:ABC-type uncharacterized transport system permease subunit